jgi:branched-subunit amino acid aminotransferase/4-amino-4-deoxychorismate lyase
MSRIAYVNGRYLPLRQAVVHVEDRGYQFGDAVYEVCEVRQGRLIDERRHLERLKRSLDALQIRLPMPQASLSIVLREVIARNRIVTQADRSPVRPHGILKGITRTVLFDVIKAQGFPVEERAFTLSEAYAAREAFVTAASQIVLPVVRIDGHVIGEGKPGPLATALRRAFHQYAEWS